MLIFNANQLTSLQKIFVIVLILYPTFTFFRAYLESPTQDYITKGKTIKNSILKKKDKNHCTHSRIRITG